MDANVHSVPWNYRAPLWTSAENSYCPERVRVGRGEERREQRKLFFVFWTTNETLRISEYFQYAGDHALLWGFVLKCQLLFFFFFQSSTEFLLKFSFYSVKKSTVLGNLSQRCQKFQSVLTEREREGPWTRAWEGCVLVMLTCRRGPFHCLNFSPRR